MPTTAEGIYEIVLEQTYQGQSLINVFHYRESLGSDDEQVLCAQAFDEDLMPGLAVLLSVNLEFNNIRCANLTGDLADINRTPNQPDGDVVGSDVVSFVAAPFRYNRTTKETRNGSKRFAGMVEENLVTVAYTGLYIAALQAYALLLETDISTVGGIFEPIILRKPPTEAGVYTYNQVLGVQALNRTTTQSSRKVF